ncbi:MAG: sulfatase [candidate division KSB1 bacterium]|nr:sulfatase [candidate division KSB1 bacterium]
MKNQNRRVFLKHIGLATAAFAHPRLLLPAAQNKQPNILFIMSDDHAVNAVSCYGSRLQSVMQTPNIDRLAKEGARLDHCFCTNSICVPSRATIMTGQYSHVNKVYTLRDKLNPASPNVAKLLQDNGYQTALFGKWHLSVDPDGFDDWNVLPGQGRYHNPVLIDKTGHEQVYKGHSTDVITDLTLAWLENHENKRPFFLMCQFKAPHERWEYADRYRNFLKHTDLPDPESMWEDKGHRSPGSREYGYTLETMAGRLARENYHTETALDTSDLNNRQIRKAAYQQFVKMYLRTIKGVDDNVGRLLNYLDDHQLTENTVVIYTSDQGYFLGEHDYIDKRWMYEESLRMPFVVRYPKEIPSDSVNKDIIINPDFAPTFLDYAGMPTPDRMQGRSFRKNLSGHSPEDWRQAMYYRYWMHCSRPAHMGVRTQRYKLIFFYGQPLDMTGTDPEPTKTGWELYDLKTDPLEMQNLYSDPGYRNIVIELKQELKRLRQDLGDTDENYPVMQEIFKAY